MELIITHMSDTHGNFEAYPEDPECDILVHSGDVTGWGQMHEIRKFIRKMEDYVCPVKILVAGNHDEVCEEWRMQVENLCRDAGIFYLQDLGFSILGLTFWGSPWTPEFNNWHFNLKRGDELREKWGWIPEDTDVLITHGPPALKLDYYEGMHLGCEDLAKAVERVKPALHLFGHIHPARGHMEDAHTVYVNGSQCDNRNVIVAPPTLITIDTESKAVLSVQDLEVEDQI